MDVLIIYIYIVTPAPNMNAATLFRLLGWIE